MNKRSETEKAIRLFFAAFNENDASRVPLSDDVVMYGPMMPEPQHGAATVRAYIDEIAPFIRRIDMLTLLVEGENAAVIVEFEALNGGVIHGAEFFSVRGGMILSNQVFFDTRPLFKGSN